MLFLPKFNNICGKVLKPKKSTSEVVEAVRDQKHPLEAKKGMKELIYQKKYLMKVAQQPQKALRGSNQIWAMTSGKKDTATSEVTVQDSPNVQTSRILDTNPQGLISSI